MTNPPLPGGIACGASHVRPGELQIALEAIRGPASDQRCAAVFINGAVGIGKSTLLDEIIHAFANRGIRTLAAKPSHEESRMSFATLNDLGVSVLDQPIIGREHTRLRGMGAVRAEAVALVTTMREQGPVVIAVDDLPRVDPDSMAVLSALLRQPGRNRLLFIATRSSSASPAEPVEEALSDLRSDNAVTTIALTCMGKTAIVAMLGGAGVGGDVDELAVQVLESTGGHPLLVHHLALEMAASNPSSTVRSDATTVSQRTQEQVVRELFAHHAGLLNVARGVGFLQSVAPNQIPLLAAVVGQAQDEVALGLSSLAATGLILLDGGQRYTPMSPLLGQAFASTIPEALAWLWHRRALTWLSSRTGTLANLTSLARHTVAIAEAGDASAAGVVVRAADALCRSDPRQAAEFYSAALQLTIGADPWRLEVQAKLSRACYLSGDSAAAVDAGRAALDGMTPGPARDRTLRLVTEASVLGEGTLDYIDGETGQDNPHLLAIGAHVLARSGRLAEAEQASRAVEQAIALGLAHDDLQCLTHLAHTYGLLAQFKRMLATIDRVLVLAPAASKSCRISAYVNSSYLLALHGSPRASSVIAHARQLVDDTRLALGRTELSLAEVVDHYRTGEWDQALTIGGQITEELSANQADNGLIVLESLQADILAHRGEWSAARRALGTRACSLSTEGLHAWAAAGIDAASGNTAGARDRLRSALSRVTVPKFREFLLARLAAVELASDRPDNALDALAEVLPNDVDETTSLHGINALHLYARITEDVELLRTCLQAADERQAALLRGRIRLDLAELGDEPDRRLREAYEIFHRLGADPWRRRAAQQLRCNGLKVPRYRGPRQTNLTDAELQVARMVQQGLRNREIAIALSMSVKTVEAYLTRAYAKTSCASRLELARALDHDRLNAS